MTMLLLILKEHIIFSRSDGHGGTITYHYYDSVTWVVAACGRALDRVVADTKIPAFARVATSPARRQLPAVEANRQN
jgi:hypothetical protein